MTLSKMPAVALLALGIGNVSSTPTAPGALQTSVCMAPASASLIGLNGAEAGGAVDELLSTYVAGPGVGVVRLQSRVPVHARSEAAGLACAYTLFTTVKHERRTSGLMDRLAAGAIHSGAGNAAALVESTAGRVLAGAAAGAAGTVLASGDVRTRDQLSLSYRLELADGRVVASKTIKRRANVDGEDMLTPMIEIVAGEVVATVAGI